MDKILICGYGDIGARVAQSWFERGAQVIALCRTDPALKSQASPGGDLQWFDWNLDQHDEKSELPVADIIYYFAPPPKQGDKDSRLAGFLSKLSSVLPKKLVLISTSAVYGDCRGEWVTEQTTTNPQTDRGKRRLDAEQTATAWCDQRKLSLVILRVPGIYGPGRLPIERLKKGLPVLQLSEAPYTNRIHSEDLAQICVRVAEHDIHGVFNVCDGEPGNMSQYFFAVADACGLPRPPEVDIDQAREQLSAGMLSYLSESRRMDNSKLLAQTGYTFLYPNLAAGLAACSEREPLKKNDNMGK